MRYRDLATGVWLTRDPAGFVDGPNLYAYVRQNPWSSFDPEGLAKIDVADVAGLYQKITGRTMRGLGVRGKVTSVTSSDLVKAYGNNEKIAALQKWEAAHGKVVVKYKENLTLYLSSVSIGKAEIGKFSRLENGSETDIRNAWAQWKAANTGENGRRLSANQMNYVENNFTWHHTDSDGQLQLVPRAVNNAFPHTGGAAMARAGAFDRIASGAIAAGTVALTTISATADAAINKPENLASGIAEDASKTFGWLKLAADAVESGGKAMMRSIENQVYGPPPTPGSGEVDRYKNYRTP